jgi:hypothetical protein
VILSAASSQSQAPPPAEHFAALGRGSLADFAMQHSSVRDELDALIGGSGACLIRLYSLQFAECWTLVSGPVVRSLQPLALHPGWFSRSKHLLNVQARDRASIAATSRLSLRSGWQRIPPASLARALATAKADQQALLLLW